MGFLEDLKDKYNARFVTSAPLRVDFFTHALETDPEANSRAAKDLLAGKHETLLELPRGKLISCKDGIIFLTEDGGFPIKFFCAWKSMLVKGKPAIQSKFVWCDEKYRDVRIGGKPLAPYCLFNVLLPLYQIVVSADEHTPDGERLEKNQIRHARAEGIFVYVRDEGGKVFSVENPAIVLDDSDLFWGYSPAHKEQLFIFSTKEIF